MKKARKRSQVDALDAALSSKEKLAAARREEDHRLWSAWKQDPSPQNMHVLMKRFEPVFRAKERMYRAPVVNKSAFRANLKLQAVNALETFDPSRSSLRTHLDTHLRRSIRYNTKMQNMAYMPEGQTQWIGPIDQATDSLTSSLGRAPSHREVSSYVNTHPELLRGKKPLTTRMVARVQGNRRRDIVGSSMEGEAAAPAGSAREQQVLGLLRPTLNAQQQRVFDHVYGLNGAPRVESTGELARRLGMNPSQVSRIKTTIVRQYKRYA